MEMEDGIEQVAPREFKTYKRLRELEHEMEEKIQRKRCDLDMQVRSQPQNARRTLQVRVYHTFSAPCTEEPEGTWTLRIEGAIKNGGDTSKRFSSFFRKIIVELDSQLHSNNTIEWTCFRSAEETDGFELTRKGNQTQGVQIKLLRNYSPERFQVSDALLPIVAPYMDARRDDTRQNIVLAVWKYAKYHNLLQENDSRVIVSDQLLQKVFGKAEIQFNELLAHVKENLHPLQPIELKYQLSFEGAVGNEKVLDEQHFDVEIDTEEAIDRLRGDFFEKLIKDDKERGKELELYEEQCKDIISHLNQLYQEREWLSEFSQDPVPFLQDVVKSQNADLALLAADYAADVAMDGNGEFFRRGWVPDAIDTVWNAAT